MISLFDTIEKREIRRLYDIKHRQKVLSLSWIKDDDLYQGNIIFYALFQDGLLRFFDLKLNQHTQSCIFETKLPVSTTTKGKINDPCCKSLKCLIAISNLMGKHSFAIHRIC